MVAEQPPRTPAARARAEQALARLARHAGEHTRDLVVIGGLNPGLLAGGTVPAHQGTTDVDVFLKAAVVFDRDEQDFAWLERALGSAGFHPWTPGVGWRWRTSVEGLPVKVEFLCDLLDDRGQEIALPGTQTVTAMNVEGPAAALRDTVVRQVVTEGGQVTVPFAGLGGYLVAKAAALVGRREPRDFYDFAFVLLHNPGGPEAAARAVARVAASGDPARLLDVRAALGAFREEQSAGPSIYAQQRQLDGEDVDAAVLAQDAVGAALRFAEVLDELAPRARDAR